MFKNIDHKANGFDVERTFSGQRRRYGDTTREFLIKTGKSQDEVEKYCTENVLPCKLTTAEYLSDERNGVKDFGDHFRPHYALSNRGEGVYFYCVTEPSTH